MKDEISFIINNLNRGVAFKNCGLKETKYHLLVQIWGPGTGLTIINKQVVFDEKF